MGWFDDVEAEEGAAPPLPTGQRSWFDEVDSAGTADGLDTANESVTPPAPRPRPPPEPPPRMPEWASALTGALPLAASFIPRFDVDRSTADLIAQSGGGLIGLGIERLASTGRDEVAVDPQAMVAGYNEDLLLGGADELNAAAEVAVPPIGRPTVGVEQAYQQARGRREQLRESAPESYAAGRYGATAAQVALPGGAEVGALRGLPAASRAGLGAAEAAGASGIAGFLGADGDLEERAMRGQEGYLLGGTIGTGLGLAGQRLAANAERRAREAAERADLNRLGQAGLRSAAGARELFDHMDPAVAARTLREQGAFGRLGLASDVEVAENVSQASREADRPGWWTEASDTAPPEGIAGAGARLRSTLQTLGEAGETVDMRNVAQRLEQEAGRMQQVPGEHVQADALRSFIERELLPHVSDRPGGATPYIPRGPRPELPAEGPSAAMINAAESLPQVPDPMRVTPAVAQQARRATAAHYHPTSMLGQAERGLGAQSPLSKETWRTAYGALTDEIDDTIRGAASRGAQERELGLESPLTALPPTAADDTLRDRRLFDISQQIGRANEQRAIRENMTNRQATLTSNILGGAAYTAAGGGLPGVGAAIAAVLANRGLRRREHAVAATINEASRNWAQEFPTFAGRLMNAARRGPVALAAADYLLRRQNPEYRQMMEQAREAADSEENEP